MTILKGYVLSKPTSDNGERFRFAMLEKESQEIYVCFGAADKVSTVQERSFVAIANAKVAPARDGNKIFINATSKIFEIRDFTVNQEVIANYCEAGIVSIAHVKEYNGKRKRVSVEGYVSKVYEMTQNEPSSPRKWKRLDVVLCSGPEEEENVKLKLWNKNADQSEITEGSTILVRNVETDIYKDVVSLSSTDETKISNAESVQEALVEVEGVSKEDGLALCHHLDSDITKTYHVDKVDFNIGDKLVVSVLGNEIVSHRLNEDENNGTDDDTDSMEDDNEAVHDNDSADDDEQLLKD